MEVIDVGSLNEGDRIRWQFPPLGNGPGPERVCRIGTILNWGDSQYYGAPYIDFIEKDGPQRAIALPFITHLNGRRVDRRPWEKRLPELDLKENTESSSSAEEENHFGVQLIMPLTEEDIQLAKQLKTSTRKSLDEMSESHRAHIEKWEPHIENLGAEHVWVSANRFSGRGGDGPVYVGIKRGSKDYAIVDYDTEKQVKVTKSKVLEDGLESSKALLEAFKEYRQMAKEERQEDKASKKETKKKPSSGTKKKSSSSAKSKAKPSTSAKKKATRKKAPKK